MKKLTFLFVLGSLTFFCGISNSQYLDGWFKAGSTPASYEIGIDEAVKYNEQPAYYMKSITESKEEFGTIMRYNKSTKYTGNRLRMTGMIKSENIDGWAGMWMRVDAENLIRQLQFDNMADRPIKGTNDWTKYEIVLDVPENSSAIAYGVLIEGNEQIWFDNLTFEAVGNDVPTTNLMK